MTTEENAGLLGTKVEAALRTLVGKMRTVARDEIGYGDRDSGERIEGLADELEAALPPHPDEAIQADAALRELQAWKESALASLNRWHAVGDALQAIYPLPLGVDIPTALLAAIQQALVPRTGCEWECNLNWPHKGRPCNDGTAVLTAIVRAADEAFQKSGGSSRHWVRDCFLPRLNEAGFRVAPLPPPHDEQCEAEELALPSTGYSACGCADRVGEAALPPQEPTALLCYVKNHLHISPDTARECRNLRPERLADVQQSPATLHSTKDED